MPDSLTDEETNSAAHGPDTSSFMAFLRSLLSSEIDNDASAESNEGMKEKSARKSLVSRGKQSLRAIYHVAKLGWHQNHVHHSNFSTMLSDDKYDILDGCAVNPMQDARGIKEPTTFNNLPDISDASMLISESQRASLYAILPALIKGKQWLLLYSTWKHGISLSTLYRRSMISHGLSLLIVGDREGSVFGGLVETPLKPTNNRKYQGTSNTFVFTYTHGDPVIFRPTGANRYFTLCSNECLAMGGGGHFALYLDAELLRGSSSSSETYGNARLAHTEDFEVKEVELWGFAYGSKYKEMLTASGQEGPTTWSS